MAGAGWRQWIVREWLRPLLPAPALRRCRFVPRLEILEDRVVPTPFSTSISVTPSPTDVGLTTTLNGTISDPNTGQGHQVTIDWGDSSADTILNLTADQLTFSSTHTYTTPSTNPTINVSVSDTGGALLSWSDFSNATGSDSTGIFTATGTSNGPAVTGSASTTGDGSAPTFNIDGDSVVVLATNHFGTDYPYLQFTTTQTTELTSLQFQHNDNHNFSFDSPSYDAQLQIDTGSGYTDIGSPVTLSDATDNDLATVSLGSLSLNAGTYELRWIPTGLVDASDTGSDYFALYDVMLNGAVEATPATGSTSVTVNAAPAITTTTLPGGTASVSYSQAIATSGGTTPLTFSIASGSLPDGLNLDSGSGLINGMPTTPGTYDFTVQAEDAADATASQPYSVTIAAPVLYWDPNQTASSNSGGSGTWDTSSLDWFNGTNDVAWNNDFDATAVFGNAAAGTVTLATDITAQALTFNSGGYTLQENSLTLAGGTGTVSVSSGAAATIYAAIVGSSSLTLGGGTLVLAGDNTYTGNTTINDGTLDVTGSLDNTAVTVNSPGTLVLNVNNTNDSGPGSLRQALLTADNTSGVEPTITFAIGTLGSAQTIYVGATTDGTPLPSITQPVVLDGWSQGGSNYDGSSLITLDGTETGPAIGLDIENSDVVVEGFTLDHFGTGILLGGSDAQVLGNSIVSNSGDGIDITSWYNLIGGTQAADANVIANNSGDGIHIEYGTGNTIRQNSIFGNAGGLGIYLEASDGGVANNGQASPTITNAVVVNGNLSVTFTVQATLAESGYPLAIDFYLDDGTGQGKTYLGSTTYPAANAEQSQTVGFSSAAALPAGAAIVATATDDGGNTSEFSTSFPVDFGPQNLSVSVNPTEITVGQSATLQGQFTDANDRASHTVTINWNDGTANTVLNLGPGVLTFSASHEFLNTLAAPGQIQVRVSDAGGGTASAAVALTVNPVPVQVPQPVQVQLPTQALTAVGGGAFAQGSFTDLGPGPWTAQVDYGDGTGPQSLSLANKTFVLSHAYAAEGDFTVTVTVTDTQTGSQASAQMPVYVLPATPVEPIIQAITGQTVVAIPGDVGTITVLPGSSGTNKILIVSLLSNAVAAAALPTSSAALLPGGGTEGGSGVQVLQTIEARLINGDDSDTVLVVFKVLSPNGVAPSVTWLNPVTNTLEALQPGPTIVQIPGTFFFEVSFVINKSTLPSITDLTHSVFAITVPTGPVLTTFPTLPGLAAQAGGPVVVAGPSVGGTIPTTDFTGGLQLARALSATQVGGDADTAETVTVQQVLAMITDLLSGIWQQTAAPRPAQAGGAQPPPAAPQGRTSLQLLNLLFGPGSPPNGGNEHSQQEDTPAGPNGAPVDTSQGASPDKGQDSPATGAQTNQRSGWIAPPGQSLLGGFLGTQLVLGLTSGGSGCTPRRRERHPHRGDKPRRS